MRQPTLFQSLWVLLMAWTCKLVEAEGGGVFRGARRMRSLHLWISRLGALYEDSTDVAKGKDVHTFTFEAYHVTSRLPFMLTMLKNLQIRSVASCWHFNQAKILRFQNLFESIQLQDSPGISHARLSAIGPGCSARGSSKQQYKFQIRFHHAEAS